MGAQPFPTRCSREVYPWNPWGSWENNLKMISRSGHQSFDYEWAQGVKNLPAMQETWVSWVRKIPWRRERLPILVFWPGEFHGLYSPWGHKEWDMTEQLSHTNLVKNLPANTGDPGLIPESGRSPREGNGNPLQYSCLVIPMDRGIWGHKVSDMTYQLNNNNFVFLS